MDELLIFVNKYVNSSVFFESFNKVLSNLSKDTLLFLINKFKEVKCNSSDDFVVFVYSILSSKASYKDIYLYRFSAFESSGDISRLRAYFEFDFENNFNDIDSLLNDVGSEIIREFGNTSTSPHIIVTCEDRKIIVEYDQNVYVYSSYYNLSECGFVISHVLAKICILLSIIYKFFNISFEGSESCV